MGSSVRTTRTRSALRQAAAGVPAGSGVGAITAANPRHLLSDSGCLYGRRPVKRFRKVTTALGRITPVCRRLPGIAGQFLPDGVAFTVQLTVCRHLAEVIQTAFAESSHPMDVEGNMLTASRCMLPRWRLSTNGRRAYPFVGRFPSTWIPAKALLNAARLLAGEAGSRHLLTDSKGLSTAFIRIAILLPGRCERLE
jgi:hypothetical protein